MVLKLKRNYNLLLSLGFYKKIEADIVENFIKKYSNSKGIILDVSCGTGLHLMNYSKYFDISVGLDIKMKSLHRAKKLGLENIFNGSAENLPFKENSFDFIICIHSLEHMKDDKRALEEMERILKPNGHLIMSLPHAEKGEYLAFFPFLKKIFKLPKKFKKIFFTSQTFESKNFENFLKIMKKEIWWQENVYKIKDLENIIKISGLKIRENRFYLGPIGGFLRDIMVFKIFQTKPLQFIFYFISKLDRLFKINDKNSYNVVFILRKI